MNESIRSKPIPGFSLYVATEDGQIVSIRTGKALRQSPVPNGYRHVHLHENGKKRQGSAHGFIASAWHGPRPKGMVVNHIDNDKSNNRPSNLEWVTPSRNVQHAYDIGARTIDAEHRKRAALLGFARRRTTAQQEQAIRSEYSGRRGDIQRLSEKFGFTRFVISRVIQEAA